MAYSPGEKYSARNTLYATALLLLAAACGGNSSTLINPSPNPGPVASQVTLQVYNATTGQKKDMIVDVPSGSSQATISAQNLAKDLDDVVTSEFAVRNIGDDTSLGSMIMAAGPEASISSPGNYAVFVPANGGRYNCMPVVNLKKNKKDFVVGVLNKPGVDPNGLPMYVWTDAIVELNKHMQSDSGMRYGSIKFNANAANPDITVGFANELVVTNSGATAPAWSEGFTNCYMLGPKSVFPLSYDDPATKDGAIEELFESLFGVDNICGTGTRFIIGKAAVTGNTQWGLNDVGVNLLRRDFTRAR